MYKPLADFLQDSEVRIVNDNLHFRMLPAVAKNYDHGMYDAAVDMWVDLVAEISRIGIRSPDKKKKVFYIYFVPDDFYSHMSGYENTLGKPEVGADADGFVYALCYLQQVLLPGTQTDKLNLFNRVTKLHELSHLVHSVFGKNPFWFGEGVAEIVPWYLLGYEKRIPTHLKWMRALPQIYTLEDFSNGQGFSREKVEKKISSYRTGYVSMYLITRAIVSGIAKKLKISPVAAVQKFLDLWHNAGAISGHEFTELCANIAGMDAHRLIYTTYYQNIVLDDIQKEITSDKQLQQGRTI